MFLCALNSCDHQCFFAAMIAVIINVFEAKIALINYVFCSFDHQYFSTTMIAVVINVSLQL